MKKVLMIISVVVCFSSGEVNSSSENIQAQIPVDYYTKNENIEFPKSDSIRSKIDSIIYLRKENKKMEEEIVELKRSINHRFRAISENEKTVRKLNKEEHPKKWIFFNVKPEPTTLPKIDSIITDSIVVKRIEHPTKKESFIKRIFHHKKN